MTDGSVTKLVQIYLQGKELYKYYFKFVENCAVYGTFQHLYIFVC